MEEYRDCIDEVVTPRDNYLACLPEDILGIIRGMHPQVYSFETVLVMLDGIMSYMAEDGQDGFEYFHIVLFHSYRDQWLYAEAVAKHPRDWWVKAKHFLYPSSPEELEKLCRRLRGNEFWDEVIQFRYSQRTRNVIPCRV